MPKRVVSGIVTSDKMDKTRRVEINRVVQHPKYKKFIRRRTVCYAHDENNESGAGDRVEIIESPPSSKLKRWTLGACAGEEYRGRPGGACGRPARVPARPESEAIEAAHGMGATPKDEEVARCNRSCRTNDGGDGATEETVM